MKSYTDISQSKKLAEILPLESADMSYTWDFDDEQYYISTEKFSNWRVPKYAESAKHKQVIPCWTLAALLGVLEHPRCFQGDKPTYWFCGCFGKDKLYHEVEADNPVDACYEMIILLNKLNLL